MSDDKPKAGYTTISGKFDPEKTRKHIETTEVIVDGVRFVRVPSQTISDKLRPLMDWIADRAPDWALPMINRICRVLGYKHGYVHIYWMGKRVR